MSFRSPCAAGAGAERFDLLRAREAWARAVGPHLQGVSGPASLRSGRLVVVVKDSAWKRELERLGPVVRDRLAALLPAPAIREITFRVGSGTPGGPARGSSAGGRPAAERPAAGLPAGSTQEAAGDRLAQVRDRYLAALRAREEPPGDRSGSGTPQDGDHGSG